MCGTIFTGAENTRRGRSGNGRSGAGRARNVPSRLRARGRGPRKQAPPGRRGSGRGRLRAAPGGAAARGFRPDRAGGARSPRPLRRACAVRPSHTHTHRHRYRRRRRRHPRPPRPPRRLSRLRERGGRQNPVRMGVRILRRGVTAPLRPPPPGWRSCRASRSGPGGRGSAEGKALSAVARTWRWMSDLNRVWKSHIFQAFVK